MKSGGERLIGVFRGAEKWDGTWSGIWDGKRYFGLSFTEEKNVESLVGSLEYLKNLLLVHKWRGW